MPGTRTRKMPNLGPFAGVVVIAALLLVEASSHAAASPTVNLDSWMGDLQPVLGSQTLLDLALPMTHDTLTYDMSTEPSKGAWDDHPDISELLHLFHGFGTGEYIRDEARTQGLDIVAQLNNGVRFLDFRMMKDGNRWLALHFVESIHTCLSYLHDIRSWVDAHPTEVIMIATSRHGAECLTGPAAYPGVTSTEKQAWWKQIKTTFEGVLFDSSVSALNTTTLDELVQRQHRVVLAMGDYQEFSAGDPLAVDACYTVTKTEGGPDGQDLFDTPAVTHDRRVAKFAAAGSQMEDHKRTNRFYSLWVQYDQSCPAGRRQLALAGYLRFLPFAYRKSHMAECVAKYQVPGMEAWCPRGLQDNSLLNNFYLQAAVEHAYLAGSRLPSMAVNMLDAAGTIRTGTAPLQGEPRPKQLAKGPHATTGYAWVATLVASNVRAACAGQAGADGAACAGLMRELERQRALHPMVMWDDATHGRRSDMIPALGRD